MRLKNKTAIVTGSGAGIGRAIAETFAREGAAVVVATRYASEGEELVRQILSTGGKAVLAVTDVSAEVDVTRMVEFCVSTFGRIDVLVNNAGVNFSKPFETVTSEDWDRVMGVDLRGAFLCSRYVVPHMIAVGGGAIVNISSVHSQACVATASAYDAAKWGIVGLTKALAVEFATRRIRVNAVSPGLIATKIWDEVLQAAADREAALEYWKSNIPAGRVGTPDEVAQVALFLASDDASYVTGSNYVVDGGMTSLLVSLPSYESRAIEGT